MTAKLEPDAVAALLNTNKLGRRIVFSESTASTNADAKFFGRGNAVDGTLFLTARQTAGRGRRGRSWLSDEGALCFTLLIRPEFHMTLAPRLVIACAVGACRALRSYGVKAEIKWPNDIVVGGKKLCGILCEADQKGFVAAGMGINVNQKTFQDDISQTACSLYTETGEEHDMNAVAAGVINECEGLFALCASDEGYAGLIGEYLSMCATIGRKVRVIAPDGEYEGEAVGLDAQGRLRVRCDKGRIKVVNAGDVSIRPAEDQKKTEES